MSKFGVGDPNNPENYKKALEYARELGLLVDDGSRAIAIEKFIVFIYNLKQDIESLQCTQEHIFQLEQELMNDKLNRESTGDN